MIAKFEGLNELFAPVIVVDADLGHFHEEKNPLQEFIRAIIQNERKNSSGGRQMLDYFIENPHFDKATGRTTIRATPCANTYRPSDPKAPQEARFAEMNSFVHEDFLVVTERLNKLLTQFAEDPSGFATYEFWRRGLHNGPTERVRELCWTQCNSSLLEFIRRAGYEPASRKGKQ